MSVPTLRQLAIPGVIRVSGTMHTDLRGGFSKLFASSAFPELAAPWAECYVTTSRPGVLRGMHLQLPPHAHDKLVVCIEGQVQDVVLDLRVGSPTHGRYEALQLDGSSREGVLVPLGCAHGFCVIGDAPATLLYLTTSEHEPSADTGVRWDSFGMAWPVTSPAVSPRDAGLPQLHAFASPFRCPPA